MGISIRKVSETLNRFTDWPAWPKKIGLKWYSRPTEEQEVISIPRAGCQLKTKELLRSEKLLDTRNDLREHPVLFDGTTTDLKMTRSNQHSKHSIIFGRHTHKIMKTLPKVYSCKKRKKAKKGNESNRNAIQIENSKIDAPTAVHCSRTLRC